MRFRPSHIFMALVRFICRAALRVVITGLIFTTCLLVALAYLGVPLSDLYEVPGRFESVSRLAELLS
jgi:hypothetical protein